MNNEKIIAWAVMKDGECLSVRRFEPVASGEAEGVEFVPLVRFAEQPAQQQETEHIIHLNGRYSPLLTHMMNKRAESNVKQVIHLYDEPHPKPAQLPFGVGGGLVAIKTLLSRDPCVHANTAIQMIDAMLAEQPAPPPECQTEAEKTAYAFGWFKGLESVRQQPSQDDPDLQDKGPELVEQPAQRKPLTAREASQFLLNLQRL